MKKFGLALIYIALILTILSITLDKLFTYFHYNGAPRNEVDWIMGLEEKDSLDYLIIGSSRAIHHVDINKILKESGQKGAHFGAPGISLFEIKLSTQQLIKRKISKKIFIQIDYIWNEHKPDGVGTVNWLPYITEDDIWSEFEKVNASNDYLWLRKIPFYRYCKYDAKLGFRELLFSLSGKQMQSINKYGFMPLEEHSKDSLSTFSYDLKTEFNEHIRDIIVLTKKNDVELIFFTAPMYNFIGNNQVLKNHLVNYHDFSNSIPESKYYKDQTHLNFKGATVFTELFIAHFFKKQI